MDKDKLVLIEDWNRFEQSELISFASLWDKVRIMV